MPIRIEYGRRFGLPWSSVGYIDTFKIVLGILLLIQISHFFYLLAFIVFFDYSIVDMCLALFFIVSFFMALSSQLTLFFNLEEFCNFLNLFFQEDLNTRESKMFATALKILLFANTCFKTYNFYVFCIKVELLRRSGKDSDGIEVFLYGNVIWAGVVLLLTFPAFIYIYDNDQITLYKSFIPIIEAILPVSIPRFWTFLIIAILFNYSFCIAFTVIFIPVGLMLIYVSTVSRSLRGLRVLW